MTTSLSSNKRRTDIQLVSGKISIYSGKKIAGALEEVSRRMDLYHGVRLSQIIEAVYRQGKRDGAHAAYEAFQEAMARIPHRNPGQPKRRKR